MTYLEDAGRRNNVRITGIPENAEKQDLHGFVLSTFAEKLDLEVDMGVELERARRIGPKKDEGRQGRNHGVNIGGGSKIKSKFEY